MKKLLKYIILIIICLICIPISVNAVCIVNTDLTSITIDFNDDGTKVTKVTFDYAFYDLGLNPDNDYYYNINITDADITNATTEWREGVNTWNFTTSQVPATAVNLNADKSKSHKGFMAINKVPIDSKYTGGIEGKTGTLVKGTIILNDTNVLNQLDLNKDYYIALMAKAYAYQYPSIKYNYRFTGSFYTGVHTKVNLSKYKHKVIIRFDGTEQEIEIEHNSTIGDIDEPTKEGYVFDSWYYDEELTNKASDTDLITGNMSLYPKFEKVYTVSYNLNGHGVTLNSEQVKKNMKITKPEDITADGYIFEGWYTDEELTNEYDFDSEVVSDFTLYAKWSKVILTVDIQNEVKTNNTINPQTYDNITIWYAIELISICGIIGIIIYKKTN